MSARFRLVPVALAAWAAAIAATLAPDAAGAIAITAWAAALATLLVTLLLRVRGVAVAIVVLALAAAAAAASHVSFAQPARTAVVSDVVSGGRAVELIATVVGKVERRASGDLAMDAVAVALSYGDRSRVVEVNVVIRVAPAEVDGAGVNSGAGSNSGAGLDVGAVVEARGTVRPGRPGDRAVIEMAAGRGVTVLHPPTGVLAAAADLRRGLVRAVEGLHEPAAGLVPGLAVGDTAGVSPELDAAMKESSLSHLTAVSGANCAIVVGLGFGLAALMGLGRRGRITCGLTALAGFVVLVTPEPSVVRAATMAAIAMVTLALGRPGAGVSILSLAVAVLLVCDPWLGLSIGFALSSVATASLLVCARPFTRGLARWMPRPLALALAVPLAAQLACGPLLVLIQPSVPLFGVVANLLAAPVAPIATVAGLAACLSGAIPWLSSGLAAIAWLPAAWIAQTAETVTGIPGDQLPWTEGWPGAAALSGVGVAVGVLIALPPGGTRARRCARAASVTGLALVVGVTAGATALATVAGPLTVPADWSVLACDVGQGDAILVRDAGTVALVDAGPDPASLQACLARVGVDRIDLLVLTHFDLDHIGGVPALVGRVGSVLHGPAASPDDERVVAELAAAGATPVGASAGLRGTLGDATWRVLWPRAHSPAFPSGNDASVVLDIRGGGVPAALFLGDLSAAPQAALAASATLDPPYALVKVAHHGSADQHAELYRLARPAAALLTVGVGNDYGHPRAETLTLLAEVGADVARTDRDGIVALTRSSGGLVLWRERGGDVGGPG